MALFGRERELDAIGVLRLLKSTRTRGRCTAPRTTTTYRPSKLIYQVLMPRSAHIRPRKKTFAAGQVGPLYCP